MLKRLKFNRSYHGPLSKTAGYIIIEAFILMTPQDPSIITSMVNSFDKLPDYPVKKAFDDVQKMLLDSRALTLEAPTGSGKTTLLPLLMLGAGLVDKKVLLTQPRRIAAKSVAARMSFLLAESIGTRVGFRVKGESKVSSATRIEVVTEGYALALLQADPFLSDYDWVILDEFHERHIEGDLLLAFLRDLRRNMGADEAPGIVVMTATWQGQGREALEEFKSSSIEGRLFPVEQRLMPGIAPEDLYARLGTGVMAALNETRGKILVFLPGRRELEEGRRVLGSLFPQAEISLLYGALPLDEQQRVLEYKGKLRQILLSSAVAETSLTVEGVTAVVDAGLERLPVFLPGPGLTRLVTRRVSRATADQRAGRAGRLGPGLCFRLWTAGEDRELLERRDPEIIAGELDRARLQTALWGSGDLPWVTPPPAGPWAAAGELLEQLGALDLEGRITPRGRIMASLGLSPRLAHMVLAGAAFSSGDAEKAALAASLLSEGYRFNFSGSSFSSRLNEARRSRSHSPIREEAAALLSRIRKLGKDSDFKGGTSPSIGGLLSLAYPDRVGRKTERGAYELVSGAPLICRECDAEWAVFPEIFGAAERLIGRIFEPVDFEELRLLHRGMIAEQRSCSYRPESRRFKVSRAEVYGRLSLKTLPADTPSPEDKAAALTRAVAKFGIAVLPIEKRGSELLARLRTARLAGFSEFPSGEEDVLAAELKCWLGPWLRDGLSGRSVSEALEARLDWEGRSRLDSLLPRSMELRPGQEKRIDYSNPEMPKVSGRMQEFYGLSNPLTIAGGRLTLAFELLSPARRPLQITADLGEFWAGSYIQIRGEMRGRYPKHFWPEDPAAAPPSLATGKRRPD